MDGLSAGLGIVSGVIQSYTAVVAAYDLYLDVTDFPSTYQDIRIGFMIERYRLELWASEIISERYDNYPASWILMFVARPSRTGSSRTFCGLLLKTNACNTD